MIEQTDMNLPSFEPKGTNTDIAIQILQYCIKHGLTHTFVSEKIVGLNSGYVSDVKRRIYRKYETGDINKETLDTFNNTFERYALAQSVPTQSQHNSNYENVDREQLSVSKTEDSIVVDYKNQKQIVTLDGLLKFAEVDLDYWKVDFHEINKWDTHAKDKDGNFQLAQNFQVKAKLKKRFDSFSLLDMKNEMMEELKEYSPEPSVFYNINYNKKGKQSNNLLEISIFDLHLGKLAWRGESYEDYDVKIATERFSATITDILRKASPHGFNRILFPIGNDFFNSDNIDNTTTNGTPQNEDLRWQKTYKIGRQLLVDTINYLRQFAPVDVLVIPGNHDQARMFYIGEALDLFYSNCSDVNINNHAALRKYYQYGRNLIGFTHGKYEKSAELPLIMASEVPELWKNTVTREWHLGHIHTKKEYRHLSTNEYKGVVVRYLSSLSGTEEWHYKMGYVKNIKGATGFLWSEDELFGILESSISMC